MPEPSAAYEQGSVRPGPVAIRRIPLSKNNHLLRWVDKMARLTQPAAIHWVDGSQGEYDALCEHLVQGATFIKLNDDLWPGCFLARSEPGELHGSKTARSSVRIRKRRRARPTTGKTRSR